MLPTAGTFAPGYRISGLAAYRVDARPSGVAATKRRPQGLAIRHSDGSSDGMDSSDLPDVYKTKQISLVILCQTNLQVAISAGKIEKSLVPVAGMAILRIARQLLATFV